MPTSLQTGEAIARLERFHRMITLDEAVEILAGRKPPILRRIREAAKNLWLDISYVTEAPLRKVEDVIDGELMIPLTELELLLRRCRKIGYVGELGMEVPYYQIAQEDVRLLPSDLLAALTGRSSVEFPYRIAQLRSGADSTQASEGDNGE